MKSLKNTIIPAFIIVGGFLVGCTETSSKREVKSGVTQIEDSKLDPAKVARIKEIFNSMPSPLELTQLFKKEGIRYDRKLLHSISLKKEYNTSIKKALNLGVYGADLSFSGLNTHHQATVDYFASCQQIAAELGISSAFELGYISRLERNANDRDTLLQVISDFFASSDRDLAGENHQDISTYVLAGGWVEGIYLGTSMTSVSTDMVGIKELVLNQKTSLHNLIFLLQNVKQNPQSIKLTNDFGQLETLYRDFEENSDSTTVSDIHYNLLKEKIGILRNGIIAY